MSLPEPTFPEPGADILGERARLTPNSPALVVVRGGELAPERFNYAELDARAVRCARVWTETLGPGIGLRKGDRVGILAHNRVEYLDAFFAAGKSGIILVTLGTRLTARELEHVVRDSGMKALLYDGELAETVEGLRALLTTDPSDAEPSALRHWIALDTSERDRSYGQLCEELGEQLGDDPAWRPTRCTGEDIYCLLYTSGTTGRPKGVKIPHRMVRWNGFNTVCGWQLRADDVSPIFTPLYHAGGLMAFLVPLFIIGGSVVLHAGAGGFDAGTVWRTLQDERCTVVLGVPTIWKMLLEAPEFHTADLRHVRWFISGGAPLPRYLIDAYQQKGVVFKQGFGMTEVGVNCFCMTVEDSFRKAGSIGKPMMYTEVRLVDGEGNDVGVDEVGELLFRGPHVCRGYWNRDSLKSDDATAASLDHANPDQDGWFHSGDLGRRDADGYYYVAGREKDMILSGGVNVYPAEIEAVLVQHPSVEDAAVVAVPDDRWGEVGIAFLVLRQEAGSSNSLLAADEFTVFLGERLARFKLPKAYRFLDVLPRTAYGKVVKGNLRDMYLRDVSPREPAAST